MKTYVLYHANCPDGFGAALAAWIKLGDNNTEYIPVSYGAPMPEMENRSAVFILDFSYPRQALLELSMRMHQVVVLDHHATAQRDLENLELPGNGSKIIFEMEKSGAVLAWEYFHGTSEEAPGLMRYLQDRDLWKFELPFSREVSAAIASYPMDFGKWADWIISPSYLGRLRISGEHCLRLKEQQVEVMARHHRWALFGKTAYVDFLADTVDVKRALEIVDDAWLAPVANATVFFSEVGERLLQMHPQAKFAAYYSDRSDGKRQWGLRSRPEFDCSEIAKVFGGGGHKQASGFVL